MFRFIKRLFRKKADGWERIKDYPTYIQPLLSPGDILTHPDGRPICKVKKPVYLTDPIAALIDNVHEFADGEKPWTGSMSIAELDCIRGGCGVVEVCVNGEWR